MQVTSDDAKLSFEIVGEGPPVVLLHPFPANHEVWAPVAEILAPKYRCILPDLRAHGDSEAGVGPALMARHAADLNKVCEMAAVGKAVFAGVSIGGYILFEFWRQFPERVHALVFCDTRASADTEEARAARLKAAEDVLQTGPEPFVEALVPKLLGETTRRDRPEVVEQARRMMAKMSAEKIAAVQQGMAARPDSIPTLPTINVPTLVLVGEEDTLTPRADAEAIAKGIAGSQLKLIPRAGHFAPLEQPEETANTLLAFLDALPRW
ncbi:MAG TPA: alpha/beta fold hydrolase [Terriglobales bacterium]|jgi:pimeloyl-ACP methyl ester carboxylesterase|nr:alpha/beta fold hydrolase [Terriglobales bacterium]